MRSSVFISISSEYGGFIVCTVRRFRTSEAYINIITIPEIINRKKWREKKTDWNNATTTTTMMNTNEPRRNELWCRMADLMETMAILWLCFALMMCFFLLFLWFCSFCVDFFFVFSFSSSLRWFLPMFDSMYCKMLAILFHWLNDYDDDDDDKRVANKYVYNDNDRWMVKQDTISIYTYN